MNIFQYSVARASLLLLFLMQRLREFQDSSSSKIRKHLICPTSPKFITGTRSSIYLRHSKHEKQKKSLNRYGKTIFLSKTPDDHSLKQQIKNNHKSRNIEEAPRPSKILSPPSDKKKAIQSVRTFSPSLELISEQLEYRRHKKTTFKKQEELLNRMQDVLGEYQ